jgi:hypothetical protein
MNISLDIDTHIPEVTFCGGKQIHAYLQNSPLDYRDIFLVYINVFDLLN